LEIRLIQKLCVIYFDSVNIWWGPLLSQLDDVDVACDGMEEGTSDEWLPLLQQWSKKIIMTLSELDIKEIDVVGKTFEPRSADSIGTIPRSGLNSMDIPYEVASVVKRGFIDKDGVLIRKAQVITYKEGQVL
jgi:molecular chaperone GrpE (heat shock protein)